MQHPQLSRKMQPVTEWVFLTCTLITSKMQQRITTTHTKIIFQSDAAPRVSLFTIVRVLYIDFWVVINKVGNRHENKQRDGTIWGQNWAQRGTWWKGDSSTQSCPPPKTIFKRNNVSVVPSLSHTASGMQGIISTPRWGAGHCQSLFNQCHFQIQADMAQLLYVHLYALLYWLL